MDRADGPREYEQDVNFVVPFRRALDDAFIGGHEKHGDVITKISSGAPGSVLPRGRARRHLWELETAELVTRGLRTVSRRRGAGRAGD